MLKQKDHFSHLMILSSCGFFLDKIIVESVPLFHKRQGIPAICKQLQSTNDSTQTS